ELKVIAWLGTKWEVAPMGRFQLYPHQLTIEANVWLFFIKKKIVPTRYDSTISVDYAMNFYYIMTKKRQSTGANSLKLSSSHEWKLQKEPCPSLQLEV
ncbi:hypothetical protein Csa_023718, partial [Cucumis sativus]